MAGKGNKKGSAAKTTVTLIFASDFRDKIIRALKAGNLGTLIEVEYPYNNGLQINLSFDARNIKSLFTLGLELGKIEANALIVPHIQARCHMYICFTCGDTENPSKLAKHLCNKCFEEKHEAIQKLNDLRYKARQNKEPPKEIPQSVESEPQPVYDFKIMFNPKNFKKNESKQVQKKTQRSGTL